MSRISDSARAITPGNTYVPVAAVIGAAIMAGSAVLWYQSDRAKLDAEIRHVAAGTEKRIDALTNNVEKLSGNVATLAESLSKGRETGISSQDLMIWCLRAERRNPAFQCPDEAPSAVGGWYTNPVIVKQAGDRR
jgi:hypothetical protein